MIRVYTIILVILVFLTGIVPLIVAAKAASILGLRYSLPSGEVDIDQDFASYLYAVARDVVLANL